MARSITYVALLAFYETVVKLSVHLEKDVGSKTWWSTICEVTEGTKIVEVASSLSESASSIRAYQE